MTPAKKYESRHRLTWAARYPLKPGADLRTRQAILLQIADTAISGQYYEPQAKLAERVGMSVRGIRRVLEKLCAEGALRAHRRGFKKTTRYTLMRLPEVAEHGDFLPPGEASDSTLDRTPTSSQTPKPPPFERTPRSPQIAFERTPRSYKEDITTGSINKPPLTPPSPKPGTISPTARRLHDYLSRETGRPLPESWVSYPDLQQLVAPLHFPTLGACLMEMLEGSGGSLPTPSNFFQDYDEKKAAASTRERKRKAKRKRKRQAA